MSETKHTSTPSVFTLPLAVSPICASIVRDNRGVALAELATPEQATEIVEAVNSIPLLREAEEALESATDLIFGLQDYFEPGLELSQMVEARDKINAVLARIREAREFQK